MKDNLFFKPTPLYKEFLILDLIEKYPSITQREISEAIGSSVSMVNAYIDQYEKEGYLKRHYTSKKDVEYRISKKGIERRKLLNIWYLAASHSIYSSAKDNIVKFLYRIIKKGYSRIILYGAGEVAEIMLQVINDDNALPLEVVAVIDDDPKKKHQILVNHPIISKEEFNQFPHDGILVSSYKHHEVIKSNLKLIAYPLNQIINFFDN